MLQSFEPDHQEFCPESRIHGYQDLLKGNLVPILNGWHVPNLDHYICWRTPLLTHFRTLQS